MDKVPPWFPYPPFLFPEVSLSSPLPTVPVPSPPPIGVGHASPPCLWLSFQVGRGLADLQDLGLGLGQEWGSLPTTMEQPNPEVTNGENRGNHHRSA